VGQRIPWCNVAGPAHALVLAKSPVTEEIEEGVLLDVCVRVCV